MRTVRIALIVLIAALGFGQPSSAQNLSYSLFERYLESLRQQSAIPGLSAAIVQGGQIVWEHGYGSADVEGNVAATPATPFVIGGVSEAFGSTLLLDQCVDNSYLQITDRVIRWWPRFPDTASTVANLLTHTSSTGVYRYDPARYAALTGVIQECAHTRSYAPLLASEIFGRLAMFDSVPGQDITSPASPDRVFFDPATLARYASIVSRLAVPYRVDLRGRAVRSDFAGQPLDASGGVITTVRDLWRFDAGLSTLLEPATLRSAFNRATVNGVPVPTGLGWFVQNYKGELLVWQFGMIKDAYSSLILKLPNHDVTLILLANSDGLSSPFALENGDVTASMFAKTFLQLFGL